jgi:DNA polymerase-4
MEFIDDLPIRKVPGVGKVMHEQLDLMGIKTLGDVKKYSDKMLIKKFGRYGHRLVELSGNIDKSAVEPISVAKSVSSETTLPANTDDKPMLKKYLLRQADDVGWQLRKSGLRAKAVTLKVKHNDFRQVTRRTSLIDPTQSSETIYKAATRLLDEYVIRKKVRLIGVGTSGLVSINMPEQIELFADLTADQKKDDANWEKVDKTVDSIVRKFGKDTIRKASTSED